MSPSHSKFSGKPKNKCRILYLVGQLGAGGLERQLFYLLRVMDKQYYLPAVVVWNYTAEDMYVRQIRELGVQVLPLPHSYLSIGKLVIFCRIVFSLQPEIIHSYSFFTNIAAYLVGLVTRVISIGSVRCDFIKSKVDAGILLGKVNARWPRTQIYNSVNAETTAKQAFTLFVPKQLYVVHNGLDLEEFTSQDYHNFGKVRILAVGSLLPVKRWDRLLKVARELKKQSFDFLIQIVGNGPLRISLEEEAHVLGVQSCIDFLGHRDDIPKLMSACCFLAHTSDSEGCPNVVMEAMASGRAVVATDVGDVPYLIEDGKTGFVVQRGDPEMLVERIATLVSDPARCRKMGEAGRIKAEREFSLSKSVSDTFAVYKATGLEDCK